MCWEMILETKGSTYKYSLGAKIAEDGWETNFEELQFNKESIICIADPIGSVLKSHSQGYAPFYIRDL